MTLALPPLPPPAVREAVGLTEGEGVEDREVEVEWLLVGEMVAHLETVGVGEPLPHLVVEMHWVGELV